MITVEFADNSRAMLITPANILAGDEGIFEIKSNFVVDFHK